MTIEQIKEELLKHFSDVSIVEYDYLYTISVDGGKAVKLKKSTMNGKKLPLTIKNLIK